MLRLLKRPQMARCHVLLIVPFAIPWLLWSSAAASLDKNTEDTVKLLSDLMVRGCGLGQSIAISGEASVLGVLGFRVPGLTGEVEGTYEEIPAILKKLVPDSQQATETRECMKGLMQQIFDAVLADTLQSETTRKEIKLAHLNRVFIAGEPSRMKTAADSALQGADHDIQQEAIRLSLESGNRELQSRVLKHILSRANVIGASAEFKSSENAYQSPFQIAIKEFDEETGNFSGAFLGPFFMSSVYGQGRLSGTEFNLVTSWCALNAELQETHRLEGLMTCKRVHFDRTYSPANLQVSLVLF